MENKYATTEKKDTRSGFGAGLSELGKRIQMSWHFARILRAH